MCVCVCKGAHMHALVYLCLGVHLQVCTHVCVCACAHVFYMGVLPVCTCGPVWARVHLKTRRPIALDGHQTPLPRLLPRCLPAGGEEPEATGEEAWLWCLTESLLQQQGPRKVRPRGCFSPSPSDSNVFHTRSRVNSLGSSQTHPLLGLGWSLPQGLCPPSPAWNALPPAPSMAPSFSFFGSRLRCSPCSVSTTTGLTAPGLCCSVLALSTQSRRQTPRVKSSFPHREMRGPSPPGPVSGVSCS